MSKRNGNSRWVEEFEKAWQTVLLELRTKHRSKFNNTREWASFKHKFKTKCKKSFRFGYPHPTP